MNLEDTIVAIATPLGKAALSIIRVSGQNAIITVDKIFKSPRDKKIQDLSSYSALHGYIVDYKHPEELIDEVVVTLMKGPHSFTGEDTVEISCHGGQLAPRLILKQILNQQVRLAQKGEFTYRAFFNRRIDLTQAEAVLDIIEAKTDQSLKQALKQLKGSLADFIVESRVELLNLLAYCEASIDFPEDELDGFSFEDLPQSLVKIKERLTKAKETADRGRVFKQGAQITIIGRPNVGKSTLLNAILGRERALVTEIPGTTRDSIEETIDLNGIPLKLIDTAGLRDTEDPIEKLGVARTTALFEESDIVLAVFDLGEGMLEADHKIIKMLDQEKTIIVLNKKDLQATIPFPAPLEAFTPADIIYISALKKQGIDDVIKAVTTKVLTQLPSFGDVMISSLRQEKALEQAIIAIESALQALKSGLSIDLIVVDLREALHNLGSISGEYITQDITEEIFSQFCIGK